MTVLAEKREKIEIHYISLGDSLAAGLLYDGEHGDGYVGDIVKTLNTNGYQVNMVNKGVSGFTSSEVLETLPNNKELSKADIVTISVGANDLLKALDIPKFIMFNSKYLNAASNEKMKREIKNTLVEAIKVAEGSLDKVSIDKIERKVMDLLEKYPDLLSPNISAALQLIIDNLENTEENIEAAKLKIAETKGNLEGNGVDDVGILKAALINLEAASSNMQTIIEILNISEELKNEVEELKNMASPLKVAIDDIKGLEDDLNKYLEQVAEIEYLINNAQEVQQIMLNIPSTIANVGQNLEQTIATIQQANPNVHIYVLGYYNALPYLPANLQQIILPLINALNQEIQETTTATGSMFVPTFAFFEKNYETYLPNKFDIHPNNEGYQVIAGAFMSKISQAFPDITEPSTPEQ